MVCPLCEVPPPRIVSGHFKRAQIRTIAIRSAVVRGRTTPSGAMRYTLASVE